ncbi:metal ABC transporter ATP-binding protein [Curtobacterium flaccumfaciens]|uniref:metal ABC transporter ATP-binding protein n=1 Tax=Curtobacterium flaccumfaciens TaxID=2035 RepID=UPI00188D9109|nr:metal ABC transporter ATP-binding protein [Curtobacterium flaccumfaciens]MBF4595720.1 metal ABC transporter ATP-binding protein [Curtobacterium flaccumfaciens]
MSDLQDASGGVLSARRIDVSFSGHRVLSQVDLTVGAHEFVGLIGANGAGKTTLLRVLLGVLKPSSGLVHRPPRGGLRGGIGYLPQKVSLDPDAPLRAWDVVALGIDGGRLGLPVRNRRFHERVDEILDAVGASAFAMQRLGDLSGGQQQRVLLAHALVSDPALLLLDEPLANLDPASARDVVELLDRLRRRTPLSIVMTAHDMNLLLPVLDRIVYLAGGRAVTGTPDEVVREDVLTQLYGRSIQVLRVEGRIIVLADEGGRLPNEEHPVATSGERS